MSYIAKNGRLYTSGASEALTLLDDKFSVNKSYSKGDSCIYNDYLWKFTSDKPAGEWDSSVVEQCRIMDFVDDINGRLTQVEDRVEQCELGNVYNFPTVDGATYVAPTDGYIFVNGGGTITILNTYGRISSTSNSDNMVFIRKGMTLKRVGSSGFCHFISLA